MLLVLAKQLPSSFFGIIMWFTILIYLRYIEINDTTAYNQQIITFLEDNMILVYLYYDLDFLPHFVPNMWAILK